MLEFLVQALREGGPFMWPLLATAAAVLVLGSERCVQLFLRARGPASPAAHVLRSARLRAHRPAELAIALEEAMLEVVPPLHARSSWLLALANTAQLTGLLGSLHGLVVAFEAVAMSCGGENKQLLLASGISRAMWTTLIGLLIAAPTVVLSGVLKERARQLEDEAHRAVGAALAGHDLN